MVDPGTMRNLELPANALIVAFRAKNRNPGSGQGLGIGQGLEYCPFRLWQKGAGESSIAGQRGNTFAFRLAHWKCAVQFMLVIDSVTLAQAVAGFAAVFLAAKADGAVLVIPVLL